MWEGYFEDGLDSRSPLKTCGDKLRGNDLLGDGQGSPDGIVERSQLDVPISACPINAYKE